MVLYCDLYKSCGFGNLLFIISNGLSLSYDYNTPIHFIDYNPIRSDRPNLKKYKIFENLSYVKNVKHDVINIKEYNEFNYNKIYLNQDEHYYLTGYFQSYKYFNHNIDKIKEYLFNNITDLIIEIQNKLKNISENKKTILIHVRRGDYLKIEGVPIINEKHYEDSLELFFKNHNKDDYKIILFTDDITGEVNKWNLLKKYNIQINLEEDPLKIFLYMIHFDHYIIANSSLSLISYYFRSNKDATLTMPPIWCNGIFNYEDMIPKKKLHISVINKLKNTYIINLDYRIDRKYSSLNEVRKISDNPIIFNAIKNSKGAIGCTQSHIAVLKNAIDMNLDYVVILEDDIKIINETYILNTINEIFKSKWDVIILAGVINNETNIDKYCNKVINAQTTTGYIVNNKYFKKLYKNFTEGLEKFMKTNTAKLYAIDIYWKNIQKEDNWVCLKKKYIYQESDFSDIENKIVNYQRLFKVEQNKYIEYLDDIPILELSSLNDIKNIDTIFHNYDNIIINIGCIKIPKEFIKYNIDELKNSIYEIIQLNEINHDFNQIIRLNDMFITKIDNPMAFLIKKSVIKSFLKNPDFELYNCATTRLPIFISHNKLFWLEYYNVINFIDKIYCLHLNKDFDRLDNMLDICNIFNKNPKEFFYPGNIGYNFPNVYILQNNNILNIDFNVGEIGCNLSQKYFLEDAIKNNYNKILVLEDDIIIPDNFINITYKTLKNIRDCDIIQFGYSTSVTNISEYFNIFKTFDNYNLLISNQNKPKSMGGFFCTLLSKKAILEYLKYTNPITKVSDGIIACLMRNNNLNSYLISHKDKDYGIVNINNKFISNTNNIDKLINNNIINIPLFIYLRKIKILQFLYQNKNKINIGYTNYAYKWFQSCIDYVDTLFNKKSNIVHEKHYHIYFYTDNDKHVKDTRITNNTLKILIKGEPSDQNINDYDICIGNKKQENVINIPYPFLLFSLNERRQITKIYNQKFSKKKLCCFMYSMNYPHRVDIFNKFNSKMKVDSLGKSCNNVKINNTRSIYNENETYNDIAVKIYSEYKFILAIENTVKECYYTEKLINPIFANSIPIYYGTPDAFELINKKRVIYFNDYTNIDDLIKYILELSNNEEEYNKIINEPIFNIDINLQNCNKLLFGKLDKIFGFEKRFFSENLNNHILNDDIFIKLNRIEKLYLKDYIFKNDIIEDFNEYDRIDNVIINLSQISFKKASQKSTQNSSNILLKNKYLINKFKHSLSIKTTINMNYNQEDTEIDNNMEIKSEPKSEPKKELKQQIVVLQRQTMMKARAAVLNNLNKIPKKVEENNNDNNNNNNNNI